MSELDNYRQLQLLETISNNIQTFITTTTLDHLKELPEELKIFTVQAGHIKQHLDNVVKMLLFLFTNVVNLLCRVIRSLVCNLHIMRMAFLSIRHHSFRQIVHDHVNLE